MFLKLGDKVHDAARAQKEKERQEEIEAKVGLFGRKAGPMRSYLGTCARTHAHARTHTHAHAHARARAHTHTHAGQERSEGEAGLAL